MNKMLKPLVPLILFVFFCAAVVSPAWGEQVVVNNHEIDVSTTFRPDVLLISKEFDVTIKVKHKGYLLTSLQLIGDENFKEIISPETANTESLINADGSQAFRLKAPSKPGTYECYFEGKSPDGYPVRFNIPIKIDNYDLSNARIARTVFIISCALVFIYIGAYGLGSAWGQEGGVAGEVLGGSIGFWGGAFAGFYFGSALSDMIWPNLK